VRWYRIQSCRDIQHQWVPDVEWSEQVVQACGVAEAFAKVQALGWWPVAVVKSAWTELEV
jgi:hypothetical protein